MSTPQQPPFLREPPRWLSSSDGNAFAESQTTQYDGYQQAWRLLGYFVDCNSSNNNNNGDDDNNNACQRYLLWAAYVDPNYEGSGVSEYRYFDAATGRYDQTACADGGRCAKMDCHESGTKFELLGVFKQPSYSSEWFPTLLQHQCVVNTYASLSEQQWPEGCTATGQYLTTDDGNVVQLYLHLQSSVATKLALYIDPSCQTEHITGDDDDSISIDKLASSIGLPTSEDAVQWNSALEPFYYCQPCIAHDLSNDNNNDRRKLEDDANDQQQQQQQPFACYDAAGDVSANQCYQFRSNTQMEAASWSDLDIAMKQGGMAQITVRGQTYGVPLADLASSMSSGGGYSTSSSFLPSGSVMMVLSGVFFLAAAAFFVVTASWKLEKRRQRAVEQRRLLAEPLVDTKASF